MAPNMEYQTMCRSIRRFASLLAVSSVLVGIGACGNLTAGGLAEIEVQLSGDAAATVPSPAILSAPTTAAAASGRMEAEGDTPEGEVEAEFTVFLEAANGDLLAVTDSAVRLRVDVEGVRKDEVGPLLLPAAMYTALRIVFTEIEVEIDAGLIINGVPVTGVIDVELKGDLTVTRPLTLDLSPDEHAILVIELNAASWLQAVDPVTATVDAQVFASLVTVSVR